MNAKPEIFAKSSLNEEQILVKERIGCDGIEIQLLDEMIVDSYDDIYKSAEESYDLSLLDKHEIRVVHCPLVKGIEDITIERMADDDSYLMDQCFYIAERASSYHGRNVLVVMHSEEFYERLTFMGNSWNRIVEKVAIMLDKYPHTELVIENVSPLKGIGKGIELHLSNNCTFDNIVMVQKLREQIGTDRIGTCLDTCHQMLAEKYLTAIYQAIADEPVPNLSMSHFFHMNKEYVKLIHLCDMAGCGHGKGKHGIPFREETSSKLSGILKMYKDFKLMCPITLEVAETDFGVCDGYRTTKDLFDKYYPIV